MTTYLLKPGELTLKGGNRRFFENILKRNLLARLKNSGASLETVPGRYYVRCPPESESKVEFELDHLLGISGWAKTQIAPKNQDAVFAACAAEGKIIAGKGLRSFKIEARRTDKSFPLDSYAIRSGAGNAVAAAVPSLKVDVNNPDAVIQVEIREKAYVYSLAEKGRRGLPVGSAGRGLLLLSGGIDSPVAGYMMAGRGMRIEAVYFHAYPYTSEEARRKAVRLAEIIGSYAMGVRLHTVGFTQVQMRVKERGPEDWATVLLRMAMMECAERMALKLGIKCLITGESLSQVASQTIENIACTQSRITLPVLRPLAGIDKDDTIRIAKNIGTYDTSILPYEDCCVIFTPPRPIIKGNPAEAGTLYESLDLDATISQALAEEKIDICSFPGRKIM